MFHNKKNRFQQLIRQQINSCLLSSARFIHKSLISLICSVYDIKCCRMSEEMVCHTCLYHNVSQFLKMGTLVVKDQSVVSEQDKRPELWNQLNNWCLYKKPELLQAVWRHHMLILPAWEIFRVHLITAHPFSFQEMLYNTLYLSAAGSTREFWEPRRIETGFRSFSIMSEVVILNHSRWPH